MRIATLILVGALSCCSSSLAQDASDHQAAFAVATIKLSVPDTATAVQIRGKRFATEGTTFFDLCKYAFSVSPSQFLGGPEWLKTVKFDVLADPETETRPNSDQMKALVRQLLTDRFHLVLHEEKRELPIYSLTSTSGLSKLTARKDDPNGIPGVAFSQAGTLEVRNASMKDMALFLQRFVFDRPVIDNTNIVGRFDGTLRFDPNDMVEIATDNGVGDHEHLPTIFTAIKEQWGLRLQATKGLANVYVIDHIEKPSEN